MSGNDSKKLEQLIGDIDDLIKKGVSSSSPEFTAWRISVQRLLNKVFGSDSLEAEEFSKTSFTLHLFTTNTPDYAWVEACREGLQSSRAVLQTYLDDMDELPVMQSGCPVDMGKVFVVHGHDGELRESVARLLEKQGLSAVILMEQSNSGQTIIEKFEQNSDAGAAICLFTADDLAQGDSEVRTTRARQNVVFETGFFIGKLGRNRVIVLADGDVEMPSDLNGVLYISTHNWQLDVLRELANMGFEIDLNAML